LKNNRKIVLKLLIFATISTGIIYVLYYPSFNSENWKKYPDHRSKYVKSLLNDGVVEGLEYQEIISLLGRPNIIRNDSISGVEESLFDPKSSILEYLTGGGRLIDFERVQVYIRNNKAVKAELNYD
jgi:hypothetical protein